MGRHHCDEAHGSIHQHFLHACFEANFLSCGANRASSQILLFQIRSATRRLARRKISSGPVLPFCVDLNTIDNASIFAGSTLQEYNESHAIMNLVLFEQAMCHVTRICRILQVKPVLRSSWDGSPKRGCLTLYRSEILWPYEAVSCLLNQISYLHDPYSTATGGGKIYLCSPPAGLQP